MSAHSKPETFEGFNNSSSALTRANADVILPLDRLRELAQGGIIGELAPEAYSFVGACA